MTKENKKIKDLKERNDKLNNQYRARDIRCVALEKRVADLEKENQELKKQLEEINNFINKANFANIEQLMLDYCAKTEEQKVFIDWLENEIENCKYGEENYADGDDMSYYNENELRKEILSKYKEIIGDKDE